MKAFFKQIQFVIKQKNNVALKAECLLDNIG